MIEDIHYTDQHLTRRGSSIDLVERCRRQRHGKRLPKWFCWGITYMSPKPKSQAAKKRVRKAKRDAKTAG
jgi:hypothetical protein